jgi:MoaD family protein
MPAPPDHITVTIKSFATLREVMDAQIRMDLPRGATLRSLLAELTERYPGLYELIFSAPDTLRDFVNILKNGRNTHFLDKLDTMLDDGDLIALFPPAAGG